MIELIWQGWRAHDGPRWVLVENNDGACRALAPLSELKQLRTFGINELRSDGPRVGVRGDPALALLAIAALAPDQLVYHMPDQLREFIR